MFWRLVVRDFGSFEHGMVNSGERLFCVDLRRALPVFFYALFGQGNL